jgi:GNAT superfamily N-acetyltransferase
MAEWIIERLADGHERASFCCGKPPLDTFLKSLVSQYEKRRLGRTFVATRQGHAQVVGYYTLAAGSFAPAALPASERKKLPRHTIPVIHLGRLAVDESVRGHRLGETLLFHALRTALDAADKIGAFAVDLVALDDEARRFYAKYGFLTLQDEPLHLYLPMKTVEAMFANT